MTGKDDCKPAARESQVDDDVSDSEEEPSKKKRSKESFSLGCEVLQQHIKFDEEGQPIYFERQKLLEQVHEPQKRLVEIDAIRREFHKQLMLIKICIKGIRMSMGLIDCLKLDQ